MFKYLKILKVIHVIIDIVACRVCFSNEFYIPNVQGKCILLDFPERSLVPAYILECIYFYDYRTVFFMKVSHALDIGISSISYLLIPISFL